MSTPELLTREELAAVLKVAPRTVMRWEAAGEIPVKVNTGRIRRYVLADVLAAIESPAPKPLREVKLVSDILAEFPSRRGKRG